MQLKKKQMAGLASYKSQQFEDRMFAHLKKFFKRKVKKLGEETTRKRIQNGVQRATEYDIKSEREVAKFIDLSFALHETFDAHPELPWIPPILQDDTLEADEKIAAIHKQLPAKLRELGLQSAGKKAS